jgi:multiple sugar transport system substrate-binding protein
VRKYIAKFKDLIYSFLFALALLSLFVVLYRSIPFSFLQNFHKKEVEIYIADHISPAHKKIIDDFNRLYAGRIKVIPIDISFTKFTTNERKQLFTRYLRSESTRIDLFSIDQIWIPRFSKWCEPLDTFFTPDLKAKVIPVALNASTYNGKIVAAPQFFDLALLFYQSKQLAKYPLLANEFAAKSSVSWEWIIKATASQDHKNLFLFQAANYEGMMCMFSEIYMELGGKYFDGNGFAIDSVTAVKAIDFLHDLIYKYHVSPPAVLSLNENQTCDYFLKNNATMMQNWPSVGWDLVKKHTSQNRQTLAGYTQMPHFTGKNPVTLMGGWDLMISKFSTHKKEAFEFIAFWLQRTSQETLHEEGGFIPANSEVFADTVFIKKYPELKFYESILSTVVTRPSLPMYTKLSDIISKQVHKVLNNEISSANAVKAIKLEIGSLSNDIE